MQATTLSAIRFGNGLGPSGPQSAEPRHLIKIAQTAAKLPPRMLLSERTALLAKTGEMRKGSDDDKKQARKKLRSTLNTDIKHLLALNVTDPGFGARLTQFWTDHFTVAAQGRILPVLIPDLIETAIRPHITGTFADMLKAVTQHPAMLIYLDQASSVGPQSRAGRRQNRGLNENLAREIFELHTLGVDGDYTQADVRSFALLLTGLGVDRSGFKYRPNVSEPGPHRVLDQDYGDNLYSIQTALDDLATHPDTAQHIAAKLVQHFIGESDASLNTRVADAFRLSNGDLTKTYLALLNDDRAWKGPLQKIKLPFDFITSALKAVGAGEAEITTMNQSDFRNGLIGALALMGQPLFQPPGPDGWKDTAEDWITPPGLAARIRWSTAFAERVEDAGIDPRDFLNIALADAASPLLQRAVAGSESRAEGIALTLISPEFNRR